MIHKIKYLIVSLFIFFLTWNGLYAQNISFHKIGLKDGLSSSRVFTTIEDNLGFLWIATDAGADRYDGSNIKHYVLPDFENIRRGGFYRIYLKIDYKNQIWLLASNGSLYKYSNIKDEFSLFYKIKNQSGSPLVSNNLHVDHNGIIWIAGQTGVYTFDPLSLRTELNSYISGGIHSITQDSQNNIYLAGDDGVFVLNERYELLHNLLEVSPTPNVDIHEGRIRSLFVDEERNMLWMGTDKRGLCAFDLTNYELILPSGLESHIGLSIRAIKQYTPESLIVGIGGVGLVILDLNKLEPIDIFSFKQVDPNSLSANSIFDIYQNKAGIFFISTFRGGLNWYNPNQLSIEAIRQIPGEINSLENNNILSICEVSKGIIAFGTAKGVSLWDKNENSWIHLSEVANRNNILSGFVHALAVDYKQNIWAASYTDSITRYYLTKDQYRISNRIPSGYNSGEIHSIYPVNRDLIYFVNRVNGIMSYSLSKGTTKLFPINGIAVIASLSKNKLALGGSNGLRILDVQTAKIKVPEILKSSILDNQSINSLFVDSEKNLWVGTADSGVFVVNFDKNSIEHISNTDGLPSNYIFSIVEAGAHIWVSTNKGISRIDKERNIYTLFESDGLISTDFNKNAAIKASDGNLYFGTNKGVIYFDPNHIKRVNSEKSLVLTDFYIDHKLILADNSSPLKQAINSTKKVKLDYSQNSFAIGFSTIDFIHPGIGTIEWKLEGFDNDWISYNNSNRINYTNLSPKTYVLKLRIVNEKAELLANQKQIEFDVQPPLWRTNWAYLFYVISLMLLIVVIFYLGKLKIESKNAEERLHYLMNMAHDIKTPLTLIKAPLQDVLKNESFNSNVRENLNIALNSADKLQKQMIQFLDFRKIKLDKKSLLSESIDMIDFFKDKMLAFKILCKNKNINLSFNSSVSDFQIKSDRKIVDVVVGNLISNAIKFTQENGKVSIDMRVNNKICEISVIDTGIGIPKSQQKKIFNLFYRSPEALEAGISGSGVGLVLASDLAEKINGKVTLLESSDKGSTFMFSFPYELASSEIGAEIELIDQNIDEMSYSEDKKTKLIFVEDDAELRKYAKLKLQENYNILTASNGKLALEQISKVMPDIVVTDVSMPIMDGRQLCMNLKSNIDTCHIPVILLTGLASKENVIQGLESGADEYITKPVEFDVLTKKIDSLLENRQILKRKFLRLEDDENFELSNELDKSFLDKITKYIEENISDPELSVYDLYEVSGMSRTPFYHKLKSLVDLSPSDYIRSIRLKRARTLLKNRNNNISEVAYSVGFSNPKYFSTSFKKYFGQSPSAFVSEILMQ